MKTTTLIITTLAAISLPLSAQEKKPAPKVQIDRKSVV